MKKIKLITLVMLMFGSGVFAQRNFFQTLSSGQLPQAREATKTVKAKGIFKIDVKSMSSYLLNAPMEFKKSGTPVPLIIPYPDGSTETFNMVESPILSPALAAAHPEIKTYSGNGQKDKKTVIRLSLTPDGFNAIILNVNGNEAIYFEKYTKDTYFNYSSKDAIKPTVGAGKNSRCGVGMPGMPDNNPFGIPKRRQDQRANMSGADLKTFRLAIAATAEFTAANGGTVQSSYNTVVGYANRMTAVYRNELSVSFVLVSGTNIIYTDAATDPYTNDDTFTMLAENQANLDNVNVLGAANYDVGHVLGEGPPETSAGGIARNPAVCHEGDKGQGSSNEGDLSVWTQLFTDQVVFHEVGHMFGMNHSYNSNISICMTRNQPTSVEPGSGATIMSYGFTCDKDDYFPTTSGGLFLNFHYVNLIEALDYIATLTCYSSVSTGNSAPVVTTPPAYIIPKSTPFALTGSATDINNDALTYSWEGTNLGTIAAPDINTLDDPSIAPFFRSYEPTTSPTRTYPVLSAILNGSNFARGDKLPSVGVVTTHELTVRDNNAVGGGVASESTTVTIDGNTGPFLETTNLSGTYAGLSTQTITWSVNGTDAANPNVKISLSTDGGYTFPTVLLPSTPNDGSEVITLPNAATTTARIKIEAVNNIFFDISNVNFSINTSTVTFNILASAEAGGSISPSGTVSVASGANQTFTITPNACYQIADVLVDNVSVGNGTTYTFTNVTGAHTIKATFSATLFTWQGTSNGNWFNGANWCTGTAPGATSNAVIPAGTPNTPFISVDTASINNLTIATGASLLIKDNGALQVSGVLTANQNLSALAGTLIFNGTSAQNLSANTLAGNTISNLTINNTAGVTLGGALDITNVLKSAAGNLSTGGFLTLKSSALQTARVAPVAGSITGNVTVERYIPARRAWRILAAPVSGSQTINQAWQEGATTTTANPVANYGTFITGGTIGNGFDQNTGATASIKTYNSVANNWVAVPNTNATAVNANAYMTFVYGNRNVNSIATSQPPSNTTLRATGPLKTGNQTFTVSNTGFTGIPNPFASPIDFHSITRINVADNFYVWDPKLGGTNGVGAYVSFSWNGSAYDVSPAPASPESQIIQSGQGFLVTAAVTGAMVTIKESDKSASLATNVFRTTGGTTENTLFENPMAGQGLRVNLQIVNEDRTTSVLDEVFSSYKAGYSDNVDQLDVVKAPNLAENLGMVRAGKTLVIERKPFPMQQDTITLQLWNINKKNYLLEFNPVNIGTTGLYGYLKDQYLNTLTPLSLTDTSQVYFNVDADASSARADRFSIVLSRNGKLDETITSNQNITAYPNPIVGRNIKLQFTNKAKGVYVISIFNSSGQLILKRSIQHVGGSAVQSLPLGKGMIPGIYQLQVIGKDTKTTIQILGK